MRVQPVIAVIMSNFNIIRNLPAGAEQGFDFDFGSILSELLDGILSVCLGGLSAEEAADVIIYPDKLQQRQLRAAAMRKARKAIKTGKQKNKRRRALADDMVAAMRQTAEDQTHIQNVAMIRKVRS